MVVYTLGIDFGTSGTKAAIREGNGIPEALPIGQGDSPNFLPSVVAYDLAAANPTVPVAVGEPALRYDDDPRYKVIPDIKRCLVSVDAGVPLPEDRYPWWDPVDRCVRLDKGLTVSPEDVALHIVLEAVKLSALVSQRAGIAASLDHWSIRGLPIRVGCPVISRLDTRRLFVDLAARAGFQDACLGDICEEPVLAALFFLHSKPQSFFHKNDVIVVYDFGGGTFDCSVVRFDGWVSDRHPQVTVFATGGEPFLGGVDIDEAVAKYLADKLEQMGATKVIPNRRLVNTARIAKEALTSAKSMNLTLLGSFGGLKNPMVPLDRSELEDVIESTGLVAETLASTLRTWRKARVFLRFPGESSEPQFLTSGPNRTWRDPILGIGHSDLRAGVKYVLAVGGTTAVPFVRRSLEDCWGSDRVIFDQPAGIRLSTDAVSVGAAWRNRDEYASVVDRYPFSVYFCCGPNRELVYEAFEPSLDYNWVHPDRFLQPRPTPIRCQVKEAAYLELQYHDGRVGRPIPIGQLLNHGYSFQIDELAQFNLVADGWNTVVISGNPAQHEIQRDVAAAKKEEEEEKRSDADTAAIRKLKELEGENRDPG